MSQEYLIDPKRWIEITNELVRKHCLALEALTEQQLADAIRQAIACGDFVRLVSISGDRQSVVYFPYHREQQLEFRIKELRTALHGLLERYTEAVKSGDCGNWDPETDDAVIAARNASSINV